jgi:hypothetical protein
MEDYRKNTLGFSTKYSESPIYDISPFLVLCYCTKEHK